MDKLLHLLAGAAIAAAAFPFGWVWALALTVLAGALKEVWDDQGFGEPDVLDAASTFIGGFLMTGWLWIWF